MKKLNHFIPNCRGGREDVRGVLYFLFNIKRQGVVKPPEFSFK